MGSLKQTLWWVRSSVCVCVCVPEAHSMQMVGPWGRYLRLRPHSFASARYLLNGWTDFDQPCTDTLLGGRNELIRFW